MHQRRQAPQPDYKLPVFHPPFTPAYFRTNDLRYGPPPPRLIVPQRIEFLLNPFNAANEVETRSLLVLEVSDSKELVNDKARKQYVLETQSDYNMFINLVSHEASKRGLDIATVNDHAEKIWFCVLTDAKYAKLERKEMLCIAADELWKTLCKSMEYDSHKAMFQVLIRFGFLFSSRREVSFVCV